MDQYSYVSNADVSFVDELYQLYKNNPESVDYSWQKFFEGYDFSSHSSEGQSFTKMADDAVSDKELKVRDLIYEYRRRAHLIAKTNPIRQRKDRLPRLDLPDFGLEESDLSKVFLAGREIGLQNSTLTQIIETLKTMYAGSIGFEFTHIRDPKKLLWFQSKIEKEREKLNFDLETKKRILSKLNEAVVFENFLHTKYIGQKRFSLEGGETTVPAIDKIISLAGAQGVQEVIIGMAHRGRLNVLCNIMGKGHEDIFNEFEGNMRAPTQSGDGDVKYHMGFSSHVTSELGNQMYIRLCPNPSHLEAVDPVVVGMARGRADLKYNGDVSKVLPILIHGDAAVAGQGLIYELIQMSKLPGYDSGGTIHFVINNQVGFTTDFDDARSSIYCTDIAKIVDAPVLHVNGDDPEAVVFASIVATEYRQKFGGDIFIDMVCYRRHGHNESDEPKFTQPVLYNLIAKHENPRDLYNEILVKRGDIDATYTENLDKTFRQSLQVKLDQVKAKAIVASSPKIDKEWHGMKHTLAEDFDTSPTTAIDLKTLEKVGQALSEVPAGFKPLKQIENLLKERKKMFTETKSLNWAAAELLAYSSILLENKIVRFTGQDVKRGTFSHRHAVLVDSETNAPYCNINHIQEGQENIRIFNSLLSEFAVLGFEYGYASASPNALVIWEAQFGDFANGAQVMIDQFISSAEAKWERYNGLVMLLPHGYEGQGPEHSSARFERFLQLCADNTMVVANVTQPANFFHLLRRQLAWNFRKPCIVMSPKSMLRHPLCVSPIEDFTKGGFKEVLDDNYVENPDQVKKLLLCTGKIYWDLFAKQQEGKRKDVAIVRLEQLAPLPEKQIENILKKYKNASPFWVQEEPENMGAWTYLLRFYRRSNIEFIGRKANDTPATGFLKVHNLEQQDLINQAFA